MIFLLPFLLSINTIGVNTFLDSFENPEYYFLIESGDKQIIVQKSNAPGFTIESGDNLLHYRENGELKISKIYHINAIGPIKTYYTSTNEQDPIFEQKIVGKIIKQTDNSLINSISMSLWDISVHILNIRALVAD